MKELTWPNLLTFALTITSAHLFFIDKNPLAALSIFAISFFGFKLLKKTEAKNLSLILFCFLLTFSILFINFPGIHRIPWPADFFICGFIFQLLMRLLSIRPQTQTWSLRFSKKMMVSIGLIVVPSLICLLLYFLNHAEVAKQWPLPEMPHWLVPFAVVLIALMNGLREEFFFRFNLQRYLASDGQIAGPILCSSILFGYMHFYNAFQQGLLGIFLTFLFGIIIGIQYRYFKSALLTWLTHSLTDTIMFFIILNYK